MDVKVIGCGCLYGGKKDMYYDFVKNEVVCVGWSEKEAPALHACLKELRKGDIIYLKTCPRVTGGQLNIFAIGEVRDDDTYRYV